MEHFEGYIEQEKYVPLHKIETVVEYKELPKGVEDADQMVDEIGDMPEEEEKKEGEANQENE